MSNRIPYAELADRGPAEALGLRRPASIALCSTLATLALATAAQSARAPSLHIVRASPLTLHGANFRPGESVRIVVRMGARHSSKQLHAGRDGSFTVRFPRVTLDYCATPLTIFARGELSGIARARIPLRECAVP